MQKLPTVVTVRVDEDLDRRLHALALKHKRRLADVVRLLIEMSIRRAEKDGLA